MRKLKIIEHMSLDGVIQHSADGNNFRYSDWTAPYRTPVGRDAVFAAYGESFDLILGARPRVLERTSLRVFAASNRKMAGPRPLGKLHADINAA